MYGLTCIDIYTYNATCAIHACLSGSYTYVHNIHAHIYAYIDAYIYTHKYTYDMTYTYIYICIIYIYIIYIYILAGTRRFHRRPPPPPQKGGTGNPMFSGPECPNVFFLYL